MNLKTELLREIDNQEEFIELIKSNPEGVIKSIYIDLEKRTGEILKKIDNIDGFTWGHSSRVHIAGLELIETLSINCLPFERLSFWEHDVGKASVLEYLTKPRDITTEEDKKNLKKHIEEGKRYLESYLKDFCSAYHNFINSQGFSNLVKNVEDHHKGYREEEVSQVAKVIRVIDFFDGLVTVRNYRDFPNPCVWTIMDAAEKMVMEQKYELDPHIIEVFIHNLFNQGTDAFRIYENLMDYNLSFDPRIYEKAKENRKEQKVF